MWGIDKLHPLVSLVYFIMVIGLLVSSFNPIMGAIGLVSAIVAMLCRGSRKNAKMTLYLFVPVALFLLVIQPLFSHNGETPLFYVNDMAVTLETVVFGVAALFLLLGAAAWFLLMGDIFTEEKLMYLFGKITPRLALLFSMSLRLLAQLRERFEQIVQARVFLGAEKRGIRETGTRLATLAEWSLETSVETAQSMEARGYGKRRRTSFHMFRFRKCDGIVLGSLTVIGIFCFAAMIKGTVSVSFFPGLKLRAVTEPSAAQLVLYTVYAFLCVYGCIPARGRKNYDSY